MCVCYFIRLSVCRKCYRFHYFIIAWCPYTHAMHRNQYVHINYQSVTYSYWQLNVTDIPRCDIAFSVVGLVLVLVRESVKSNVGGIRRAKVPLASVSCTFRDWFESPASGWRVIRCSTKTAVNPKRIRTSRLMSNSGGHQNTVVDFFHIPTYWLSPFHWLLHRPPMSRLFQTF